MEATVTDRFLLREALVLRSALSANLHRPRLESRCPSAAVNLIRVHRLETTRRAIRADVLFQYDFKDVACRCGPRQRGARPPDRREASARPARAAHRPPEPPT